MSTFLLLLTVVMLVLGHLMVHWSHATILPSFQYFSSNDTNCLLPKTDNYTTYAIRHPPYTGACKQAWNQSIYFTLILQQQNSVATIFNLTVYHQKISGEARCSVVAPNMTTVISFGLTVPEAVSSFRCAKGRASKLSDGVYTEVDEYFSVAVNGDGGSDDGYSTNSIIIGIGMAVAGVVLSIVAGAYVYRSRSRARAMGGEAVHSGSYNVLI